MSEIFEKLCQMRGIDEDFLRPKYSEKAADIPDLEKAAKRIEKAVKNKEKVLIYGDYDVDGVTATTVMSDALKLAGVKEIATMLPDRFKDGYGMNKNVVERAKNENVKLVITVDCGSNNSEIIAELFDAGIETIVTDHHEIMGEIPEKAVAVVNPKREDCKDKQAEELAGVGVAFMVAKKMVEMKMIPDGQEKWMLDLVLIGTICDSMVMNKLNRELCFYGMKVLGKTRRLGLKELMRTARVSKIDTMAIGFVIGPRLNAGGRMGSADISLKLLGTDSAAEAARLALKLENLNNARKTEQEKAMKEIDEKEATVFLDGPVIVVKGKWHEGVIGIIAGRLVEKYKKPAFVFTEMPPLEPEDEPTNAKLGKDANKDGVVQDYERMLKGSGRSFGDFSLADTLKKCGDTIIGGGGHAGACGVQILSEKLEEFVKAVNDYYLSLNLVSQEEFLKKKADLEFSDLKKVGVELVDEISRLEPFGIGNEEPIFMVSARVMRAVKMGKSGQHLKFEVSDGDEKIMTFVRFNAEPECFMLQPGEKLKMLARFEKSEWKGRINVEGMIEEVL